MFHLPETSNIYLPFSQKHKPTPIPHKFEQWGADSVIYETMHAVVATGLCQCQAQADKA